MPIVVVMAAGIAAVLSSFLGRTLMEQHRINSRANVERAAWRSRGELEVAKNIINTSTYTAGLNDAIQQGLAANPPFIPGTSVIVESVGPNRWYRLTAMNEYNGEVGTVMAFLRDGTSYVVYNYYVEEDDLGISGQPRGRIHTNGKLEFYFEGGRYDSFVSATDGFEYKYGASAQNTTFQGGTDAAAQSKELLRNIDYPALQGQAQYVAPVGLDAEVSLQDKSVEVKLYEKPSVLQVPVTEDVQVQTGTEYKEVTKTQYREEYQWVDVKKTRKVWVPNDDSRGGTDMAGGGTGMGYWKTEVYYEQEYKKVQVPDGTYTAWEWVPTYATTTSTTYKDTTVAGALLSTTQYPASGIFYFPDRVTSIRGDLNGKVTVVSESSIEITGNLRYRDDQGNTAYLHGGTTDETYTPNPSFVRDHALGIVAKGDIRYDRNVPTYLEVNASLISTEGMVAYEGIALDASGTPYLDGKRRRRESLRRFGSIMSYRRPVSTLLKGTGKVDHGFKAGDSVYDRSLLSAPPPGYPNEETAMYFSEFRVDVSNVTDPGNGVWAGTVAPVAGLMNLDQIKTQTIRNVAAPRLDWGATDGLLDRNTLDTRLGGAQVIDGGRTGSVTSSGVKEGEDTSQKALKVLDPKAMNPP